MFIGPGALAEAEVHSTRVVISGNLVGNVQAGGHIELESPGKLKGNLSSLLVVMGEIVLLEGHCSMTGGVAGPTTGNKSTLLAANP
ncbi:hypothetical protein DFAR_2080008 [Desulfarculales bacterium]